MSYPALTVDADDLRCPDGPVGAPWDQLAALEAAGTGLMIKDDCLVYPGTGHDSGFLARTYGPDMEMTFVFAEDYVPTSGDVIVVLLRGSEFGTAGWGAVYLVLQVFGFISWELRERIEGSINVIADGTSGLIDPSAGDTIGVDVSGDAVTAYKTISGVTSSVCTGSTAVVGHGKIGVELTAGVKVKRLVGGTVGASGNTIYLDQDNPAADDAHTYEQAQDPTTPVKTPDAAVAMIQSHDTINVVQGANRYPEFAALSPILATNVTVQGADDDATWNVRRFNFRGVTEWHLRNYVSSGDAQGDISIFEACIDMSFDGAQANRGGANILAPLGSWLWERPKTTAPLDGPALDFLDGVGWRIHYQFETTIGIGSITFRDGEWTEVQGEDGIQFLGGGIGGDVVNTGIFRVTRCYMHDFTQSDQPAAPHTDGIQILGCAHAILDVVMRRMASMLISTDNYLQQLDLVNCDFGNDGHGGYSTQFFGIFGFKARNCRWDGSNFGGLRIGYDSRLEPTNPVEGGNPQPIIDLGNSVCDSLGFTEGINDPDTPQAADFTQWMGHNLIGSGPLVADSDVQGYAEYGHTGSGDDLVTGELANAPSGTNHLAIDAGLSHADDASVPLLDRLGRPRKGAGTDLGPYESDPDVEVPVDTRNIRVISTTPVGGATGVNRLTHWAIELSPTPGETIDQSTVTDDSFNVADAAYGFRLPVSSSTISDPDEDGHQILTRVIDGELDPAVEFTGTVSTDVTDTEGSTLALAAVWSATSAGRGAPALTPDDEGGGWTIGAIA